MTMKRRLVPDSEIDRVFNKLKSYGIEIGAVDIRGDGIMVYDARSLPGGPTAPHNSHNHPVAATQEGTPAGQGQSAAEIAYANWKAKKHL